MPISVPLSALVAALVGAGGTLAVLLSAAKTLGASEAETSSMVCGIFLGVAATSAFLSIRYRMPIVTAWSTPGAALLAGFAQGVTMSQAVAVFLFVAALTLLCAALRPLTNLVARLPSGIAAGLLAGVLLRFVAGIAEQAVVSPLLVLPLVVLFLALRPFAPQLAVLAALAAGFALAVLLGAPLPPLAELSFSRLVLIPPEFDLGVLASVGLPLFLVTMASQNLSGVAVLKAYGYVPPTRAILGATGIASLLSAPFGSLTTNLSAIVAAICSGPDADPDPATRWRTGPFYAFFYLLLALAGASMVAVFAALPPALIATVAGLALLSPLTGALTAAMLEDKYRLAAVATFATTASGASAFGLGAPVFGLAAGLAVAGFARLRT
ncbi:benzoate/H(+) symporter BenE family transporter [Xanthobacter sp. KR7-225]|uniref:benzoate/H(+) symporter BenE family transporter n=1 Tax=Xanthobacter sp. KR7-225 TaxID=3156613 RepID=UPI0032B513C3